MTDNKLSALSKFYSWLLILLPVASMYQVGPLDLDLVLILVFVLLFLLFRRFISVTSLDVQMLGIIAYIAVVSVFNIFFGRKYVYNADIIFRTGKYCLYLAVVFLLGNKLVTFKYLMKVYRIVAYAATVYIVIQAVALYGAGITLPSKIGGEISGADAEVGRLRAFYSEPAAMAYSVVPFVVCSLFGWTTDQEKKRGAWDALIVSVAIVLSTSGQGIIAIGVTWVWWIFLRIKSHNLKKSELAIIAGFLVAAVVLYKTGVLKEALVRASETNEYNPVAARTSGYETLVLLSPLQRIFGAGYGNHVVENVLETGYLFDQVNYSTLAQFLFSLGIVGTLLWVVFFGKLFRNGTAGCRMVILVLLVFSVAGCPSLPIVFPIWLTLICLQQKPRKQS